LDEFFNKAVAAEVTHAENKNPQQQHQQQQQQQQQEQRTDSASNGSKRGYRPSISAPANTTGGSTFGLLGSNKDGKSGGVGQSFGLLQRPWVSTEIFEGRPFTGK
jgi:hypothetical protein